MDELDKAVKAGKQVEEVSKLNREPIPDDLPEVSASREIVRIPKEVWERYPDETNPAWDAFRTYRDLGPGRTIRKVIDEHGFADSSCHMWSRKYEWAERVAAFDLREDRIYQLQRAEAIKEMAERHGDIIVKALEAMSKPFQALAQRFEEDPDALDDLADRDLIKLLDLSSKMARNMPGLMASERAVRGMPSQTIEVQGEVTHTHGMERGDIGTVIAALAESGALGTPQGLEDGELDGRSSSGNIEISEAEIIDVYTDEAAS